MSMKRVPSKPDRDKRGGIYLCDLPKQLVTETTDGIAHHRDGVGFAACGYLSGEEANHPRREGCVPLASAPILPVELRSAGRSAA